jgi:phosphate/sulfate permease
MSRTVKLVVGAVLILAGVVWTLQGLDVIGGSGMSGHAVWAVIGPIVALVGAYLIVRAVRTQPVRDDA